MRKHVINLEHLRYFPLPVVACIGYFDGMHLGHQALIKETLRMASEKQCESALITFDPDPWVTIKGLSNVKHITTMRGRINKAIELGIDNIIVLHFTRDMSLLSPQDFIEKILGSICLKGLVCGFDFHFGYKGQGDAQSLKQCVDYDVSIIEAVSDEEGKISSTRISEAIEAGDIPKVNRMLGYPYQIEGYIKHGKHIGTGLGFPTANLDYSSEYLLPKSGVYACFAIVNGKRHQAMVNIGHNPTVNETDRTSIEAHIMNYHEDIYGKYMKIELIQYVRPEKKFKNKDNLVLQLEQDKRDIKKILNNYEQ